MELTITKDLEELSIEVAGWVCHCIERTLETQDRFSLVLSGGNTPKNLFRLLATEKFSHRIDWNKIHFFWGDERWVPATDDRNNSKMAMESLLNYVPVVKEQVHIIRTDIDPAKSAVAYEKTLRQYFGDEDHKFDLVLLGLGSDAHTLSLFPGYPVVMEKSKWVSTFYLKDQDVHRITLTSVIVNDARNIAFLVSGADKADALSVVLNGPFDPYRYPAQTIQPTQGELFWFVDEAAATKLS